MGWPRIAQSLEAGVKIVAHRVVRVGVADAALYHASGHSLTRFVCPRCESYLYLAETFNECSQFWHSKVQIS